MVVSIITSSFLVYIFVDLSGGIPDIHGLSSIDVQATHAHGIRQIAHGKLHIYPCQFLDQNENDNACRVPLHHEVWNVDHKMAWVNVQFAVYHVRVLLV